MYWELIHRAEQLADELRKIMRLIECYGTDEQFSKAQDDEDTIFNLLWTVDHLDCLEPWSVQLDLDEAEFLINELCEEFSWIA